MAALNYWCLQHRSSWNGKGCVYKGFKEVLVLPEAVAVKVHMHTYIFINSKLSEISSVLSKPNFVRNAFYVVIIMTMMDFIIQFFSRVPFNVSLVFALPPLIFVLLRQARFSLFLSEPSLYLFLTADGHRRTVR